MTKSIIDAIHDHRQLVYVIVDRLEARARAANLLGMTELAEALYEIGDELNKSAKEVSDSYSIDLNERVAGAEASSIAMVEGVLVGVLMGKESKQ